MVENKTIETCDANGCVNHVLVMHILPSAQVIANQAD